MIYYIDFDGTICPNNGNPPSIACLRVINRLKECNNEIVIYSCRSNPECVDDHEAATAEMKKYLELYKVPYDSIKYGKPLFNYYIDDRNIGVPLDENYCVDWEKIEVIINSGNI